MIEVKYKKVKGKHDFKDDIILVSIILFLMLVYFKTGMVNFLSLVILAMVINLAFYLFFMSMLVGENMYGFFWKNIKKKIHDF